MYLRRRCKVIKAGISVKVKGDGGAAQVRALEQLTRRQVLIGIPDARTERKTPTKLSPLMQLRKNLGAQSITNAQLLFIHTNGSPRNRIPARPVIEPAINEPGNKAMLTDEMKLAAGAALDGKAAQSLTFLRRVALMGQNVARGWFTDARNGWAPNKPSTIRRKGSARPLINTDQMRKAIIGVVEDAGVRA
jgi:hypothetical protein